MARYEVIYCFDEGRQARYHVYVEAASHDDAVDNAVKVLGSIHVLNVSLAWIALHTATIPTS